MGMGSVRRFRAVGQEYVQIAQKITEDSKKGNTIDILRNFPYNYYVINY